MNEVVTAKPVAFKTIRFFKTIRTVETVHFLQQSNNLAVVFKIICSFINTSILKTNYTSITLHLSIIACRMVKWLKPKCYSPYVLITYGCF